ncbi:MAG: DUF2520 domain-containing protein [Planctomycetes bacterium]|nr:DUF2520 domain-containing protein [Planctomycetota bacterium]
MNESKLQVEPMRAGIVGTGAVALSFSGRLRGSPCEPSSIFGRSRARAEEIASRTNVPAATSLSALAQIADVIFLCVSDPAIEEVASKLAAEATLEGKFVVHTSGVFDSSILAPCAEKGAICGSFHPMISFPRDVIVDAEAFRGAFAIEAPPRLAAMLRNLVAFFGGEALEIAPEKKILYHLAACMSSGFVVATFAEIARAAKVVFPDEDEIAATGHFIALAMNTLRNIESRGALNSFSGPITRVDSGTIAKHVAAIRRFVPDLEPFYREMSKRMLSHHPPDVRSKVDLDEIFGG